MKSESPENLLAVLISLDKHCVTYQSESPGYMFMVNRKSGKKVFDWPIKSNEFRRSFPGVSKYKSYIRNASGLATVLKRWKNSSTADFD